MLGHQTGEERTVHPARYIVSRGNRQECTRVIVETDRVVKAGRLRGLFPAAHHSFGAVMEPPRGTELQHRVMSRQRREFTAVSRLVQRKQTDREARFVPE